jgi:hypothetical protein
VTDPPHPYRTEPDAAFADQLERELLRRLAGDATCEADVANDPETSFMRRSTVPVIDIEPTRTRGPSRRRWPIITAAAAVVAVVVGGLVLAARGDDSSGSADQPTAVASDPEAAEADGIARGFLDAYDAYDADRAITYLTDDAIAEGWESREQFPLHLAFSEAQGYRETVIDCRRLGETEAGVTVRCDYQFHAIGSDELGLGPYTDNSWEFTIRDGQITSARNQIAFTTNGFSREVWEPFADWVATTHPDDVLVMYTDNSMTLPRITEESIRLWGLNTRRYVDDVLSTLGRERLQVLAAGMGLIGLPPEGATPSPPERGELVDGEFSLRRGEYHYAGGARLYADGRLIWRLYLPSGVWSTSTGWVEQRLTPEDVERVADHVVIGHGPGGEGREMEVSQFFGLLPPSAWEDQRPYVPTAYGACLDLRDGEGDRIDAPTEQLLAVLPAPAAGLLAGRPVAPNPDPPTPGWNVCLALSTEDARLLDRALSDAGLEQGEQDNRYLLQYQIDHPIEAGAVLDIVFEPQFPDGTISCSGCG